MARHADLERGSLGGEPRSLFDQLCIEIPKRGACAVRLLKLQVAHAE